MRHRAGEATTGRRTRTTPGSAKLDRADYEHVEAYFLTFLTLKPGESSLEQLKKLDAFVKSPADFILLHEERKSISNCRINIQIPKMKCEQTEQQQVNKILAGSTAGENESEI